MAGQLSYHLLCGRLFGSKREAMSTLWWASRPPSVLGDVEDLAAGVVHFNRVRVDQVPGAGRAEEMEPVNEGAANGAYANHKRSADVERCYGTGSKRRIVALLVVPAGKAARGGRQLQG
jgi:hypothetical protein